MTYFMGGAGFLAPGSLASSLQTEVDDNEGSPQAPPLEYVALPGGTPPCQSQKTHDGLQDGQGRDHGPLRPG